MVTGELQKLIVSEAPGLTDRVEVEEVPDLSSGVEDADLGAHRITERKDVPDRELDRWLLAPVDTEIHLDRVTRGALDQEPREQRRCSDPRHRVAGLTQHLLCAGYRGNELLRARRSGREQVDVLGRTFGDAMLADRTRSGESEVRALEGLEKRRRDVPLERNGIAHR